MNIVLNNQQWMLKGFWPWVPLREENIMNGIELMGVTRWIPATVPGGVHYDLYRAGLIEHPHIDMNSVKCEWVENRWWVYKTSFNLPEGSSEKVELLFKGLDYSAMVYLNGILLGEHEGMYEPAIFDITEIARKNDVNDLVVLFKNVPDEMSQIGKTSLTHTQKSRFNYKWDFSTRMVNIGIWDDVLLKAHKACSIGDIYQHTDLDGKKGLIHLDMDILCERAKDPKTLIARLECHSPDVRDIIQREFPVKVGKNELLLEVENARLWYPNGYGEQPLYSVKIWLIDEKGVLDLREMDIGIRKLEYAQNAGSSEAALPYTFIINGERIYVRGVNMTPIDHMYGNVNTAHYTHIVEMMKHANVNLVRVWGGGIIERETFYRLCDQNGIMVWQEFIQSSSGIDNIPSKIPEFLALLKKTAISALKQRRNHVSLTVWSGGNELMSGWDKPSGYDDENIAMLKSLVEELDPQRLFLPTSASGPVEFITTQKGISHDVHGHWTYQGNPEHYTLYGQSDSLFHSEFGVDGLSCVKSLKKFISSEHLKPLSMTESLVWRHHGEWWDTLERDKAFFGDIEDIEYFSDCSQWIQAEGLRFIVEANRRRQFENSGSIIWQFNEPWPNISCTCLMDYYGEAKMAYYWVKKAYEPIAASLDYTHLDYSAGDIFNGEVYICCNTKPSPITVKLQVITVNGKLLLEKQYDGHPKEHGMLHLGNLSFEVRKEHGELFSVRLKIIVNGIETSENLYTFSTVKAVLYSSVRKLEKPKLHVTADGEWSDNGNECDGLPATGMTRKFTVKNTGDFAALHIRPYEWTNAYWMQADTSFFTLFPGEEAKIRVSCIKKGAAGFLTDDCPEGEEELCCPDIRFRCFGEKEG